MVTRSLAASAPSLLGENQVPTLLITYLTSPVLTGELSCPLQRVWDESLCKRWTHQNDSKTHSQSTKPRTQELDWAWSHVWKWFSRYTKHTWWDKKKKSQSWTSGDNTEQALRSSALARGALEPGHMQNPQHKDGVEQRMKGHLRKGQGKATVDYGNPCLLLKSLGWRLQQMPYSSLALQDQRWAS